MYLFRILVFIISIAFSFEAFANFPTPWQLGFQDPASYVMEQIEWLHHFLFIISSCIVAFVVVLLGYTLYRFNAKKNPIPARFTHNIAIEIIWTIIPLIILMIIAVPSFRILKLAEHSPPTEMTIKVVGSQWYWSYVYPDHEGIEFDSNMIPDKDLKPGQFRMLEVDNRLVVPKDTVIKFLVTGADVIHSFAVPSLGIKIDAVPGIINETWTKISKPGVYYGQCSEICGIKHGFMPIAIEVVSKENFISWINSKKAPVVASN